MKIIIIAALFVAVLVPSCFAEKAKSHEECLKQVPGDWGPNFGKEWHKNEAIYWGCRLGMPSQTVASWQKALDEMGMAQEISLRKYKGANS